MFRFRYIYSACGVIETDRVRILTDPWFTQGIYHGSWFHYPIIPDPISTIGQVDAIYISHLHPDHYDPVFLHQYLRLYPDTDLIIGHTDPPYLERIMRRDGFSPAIISGYRDFGDVCLRIIPSRAFDYSNIDTALLVYHKSGLSLVNINDCPYEDHLIEEVKSFCYGGPTLALLPFSGAGPWPQTHLLSDSEQEAAETDKRDQFINTYFRYLDSLGASKAVPFAGNYWLGSSPLPLNRHRGLADATELAQDSRDRGRTVVLEDGGQHYIDLETQAPTRVRTLPYYLADVEKALSWTRNLPLDYELEIQREDLPLLELSRSAYRHANQVPLAGYPGIGPFWVCIQPTTGPQSQEYIVLDLYQQKEPITQSRVDSLIPRLEIYPDPRLYFGLLTRLYHWNNADIGSLLQSRMVPREYHWEVHRWLDGFHV